jgi:nicotinamide mononucleotide transporter
MSEWLLNPWWERAAVALGLIYVLLMAAGRRSGWLFGGASSLLYGGVFLISDWPWQAALQTYYVGMAAYGWQQWGKSAAGAVRLQRWSGQSHLWSIAAIAGASVIIIAASNSPRMTAQPMADVATTLASLLATWLMARAIVEHWLYWLVIDTTLATLLWQQGQRLSAGLYLVFAAVAIAGWMTWRQRYQRQPR